MSDATTPKKTRRKWTKAEKQAIFAQKKKSSRHYFYFHLTNPVTGEEITQRFPCKTKDGKKKIVLTVKADDVKMAMKAHGAGSTQCCTMAVCARRNASQFPHKVDGFVDWQYRTAYVVSKTKDGYPVECVRYSHESNIAKINDSPEGMRKLLEMIEKKGGSIEVILRPYEKNFWSGKNAPQGKKNDGSRSTKKNALGHGAFRRFAVANLGLKDTKEITEKLNS